MSLSKSVGCKLIKTNPYFTNCGCLCFIFACSNFLFFFVLVLITSVLVFLTQSKTTLNKPIDIWVNFVPFYPRAITRMLWQVEMHVKAFGKLQWLHMLSSGKSLMCWFFLNTREMWITILFVKCAWLKLHVHVYHCYRKFCTTVQTKTLTNSSVIVGVSVASGVQCT